MGRFRSTYRHLKRTAQAGIVAYGARKLQKHYKGKRAATTHKAVVKYGFTKKTGKSKTKTKKDHTTSEASDLHSGIASKSFTVVLHAKVPKHQSASWRYCQTNTALTKTGAGVQGFVIVAVANSNAQRVTDTGIGYAVDQSCVSLQGQNPNAANTGGTWYGSVIKPATDRFFLKSIYMRTELNNASNLACCFDVFYFKAKQPCKHTPIDLWTSGNQSMGLGNATEVIPVRGGAAAVAGFAIPNEPWSDPMENVTIKQYYKCVKKLSLDMAAGTNEIVHGHFVMNELIKVEETNKQILDGLLYNKNTIFVLVVARAQVCKDTSSLAPVYGPTEVMAISQVYYNCHSVDGNAGRLNASTHVTQAVIEPTANFVNYVNIVDNVAAVANVIV